MKSVGEASREALPAYVLITPARNEAEFIELTIRSIVRQTVRPVKWVIVSDGSTDGTDDIVKGYEREHRWIELVRMPERRERHFAGKVHAFNAGYTRVKGLQYAIIGNLDGDISFEECDHFAFLLRKLAENSALGIVGTPYREGAKSSDTFLNLEYVSGACQLFRRECFEAIGGYVPAAQGGVDDIAVITARMKGWETRTFAEKSCCHHKVHGKTRHGMLMARFKDGELDYALGSHPIMVLFRMANLMIKNPPVIKGLMLLAGYLSAMMRRVERPVSHEVVRFHRADQISRLKDRLKALISARPSRHHASKHPSGRLDEHPD